jgi:hypothetical protein
MSYWYDAKKEDVSIDDEDVNIYLGTEIPYDDCGNIYVTVKKKDMLEVLNITDFKKEMEEDRDKFLGKVSK